MSSEGDEPVALVQLKKAPLVGFSVWDEAGRSLPVLTTRENAFHSWSALRLAGELAADADLSTELSDALWSIVRSPAEAAVARLDQLRSGDDPASNEFNGIVDSATDAALLFDRQAEEFSRNFLLLVLLDQRSATTARRVIKFAFDEEVALEGRRGLRSFLGLEPTEYLIEAPAVGEVDSYHLEVEAPDGLNIVHGEMSVSAGNTPAVNAGSMAMAHFHVSSIEPASGTARVALRPQLRGFLRAALMVSLLATALLLLGSLFPGEVQSVEAQADAGAAILLIIPATLAASIARPTEHLLASHVLLGPRLASLAPAMALYVAAISVVLSTTGCALQAIWGVGALVSGACAILLGVNCHRSSVRSTSSGIEETVGEGT